MQRFVFLSLLALLCAIHVPANAIGPPIRSTHYDGTSGAYCAHPHQPQFDSSVAMTIEAWVYREDSSRCETVVGHDFSTSYWFGFCSRPRFYRSGGSAVTSSATINAWQWTHVAVTYDGANARFYVNGAPTDTLPLANAGAGANRNLVLGANPASGGASGNYPFKGYLDEVRIWSVVRSQKDISDSRFQEIRSAPGLVAAFGTGGKREDLTGSTGTSGPGAAERIRGILPRDLVVPKAAVTPIVDGSLGLDGEYAGAEELVIPYMAGPNEPDAVAWLVYTNSGEENLYVGVGRPRHTAGGWSYDNTRLGLLLDPYYSRNATPQATDVLFSTALNYDNNASSWLNGNGSWYEQCTIGIPPYHHPCVPGSSWQAAKGLCSDDVDPYPPCVEFRVSKSRLGTWTEYDELAIVHLDWNSSGFDSMAPADALPDVPSTWAKVSYGDTAVDLPHARISGKVHAGLTASAPGLGSWGVGLLAGSVTATTQTQPDGSFSFDVAVPPDTPVNVYVSNCGFCRYAPPRFTGTGIAGSVVHDLQVRYPGCTGSTCDYQSVAFFVRQPPPPMTVTGMDPPDPQPTLVLRDNPRMTAPATPSKARIYGTNLHEFVTVALSPVYAPLVCPCPGQWVLYPCQVTEVAPDGSYIEVNMPTLPRFGPLTQYYGIADTLQAGWRWVLEDTWIRTPMTTYGLWPPPGGPEPHSFALGHPEYPLIWGFGFENKDTDPGWREFSAVYGWNAYDCVFWDLDGDCIAHIMDPLYAAFYPIYWLVGKAMTGSCAGMASTSLLFQSGLLDAQWFDTNVYYPAGFRQVDQDYQTSWSRSVLAVLTAPAEPRNLWAWIRVGQMTQISNQFLTRLIGQGCGVSPFCGYPAHRFVEISNLPVGYVAAMVESISQAHAITPYAISGDAIRIYDNNHPHNTSLYIGVDTTGSGTYTYTGSDPDYDGTALFTFPMSLWTSGRTAPIADILGTAEFLLTVIVGGADALVATSDGNRWGWLPDGAFVNEIHDAVSAVPMSAPGLYEARSVPLLLPASKGDPQVTINARGGDYLVHAGNGGVMLQLHAFDSAAGDTDHLSLNYDQNGLLESLRFTPQRPTNHVAPSMGIRMGENMSALFRWIGLSLWGGQTAEFRALRGQAGVEYVNESGGPTSHYLLVNGVDGPSGKVSQVLFGPITVPNGASEKASIVNWPDATIIQSDMDFDRNGTVDQTANVQGVVPVGVDNIGSAKLMTDGTLVSLQRVVATTSQNTFSGFFYCQDPGGTTGIKVLASATQLPGVRPGTMLQVIGHLSTDANGERQISSQIVVINHAESEPRPLVMRNESVGGTTFGSPPVGQLGSTDSKFGLNTIGSLVRTTGRVLVKSSSKAIISDGSGTVELDLTNAPSQLGQGAYVEVTGISALKNDGSIRPRYIVLRSPDDLVIH